VSQRAFLAELDADLHGAFADAGMADIGAYTAPDAEPTEDPLPVRVYVDRNVQTIGEFNQIAANRTEVSYVRADVAPVKGARLVVDGETFINVEVVSDDGSLSRWLVRRG
jgi:hypothetical protein